MEGWEMGGGSGVRDVISGANDGLVSILALVAGAVAGAYLWSKSSKEVTEK